MELFIGIMSGTSLDGIDAALVATNGRQASLLARTSAPFAALLRQGLLDLAGGAAITAQRFGELDTELGQAYWLSWSNRMASTQRRLTVFIAVR